MFPFCALLSSQHAEKEHAAACIAKSSLVPELTGLRGVFYWRFLLMGRAVNFILVRDAILPHSWLWIHSHDFTVQVLLVRRVFLKALFTQLRGAAHLESFHNNHEREVGIGYTTPNFAGMFWFLQSWGMQIIKFSFNLIWKLALTQTAWILETWCSLHFTPA